MGYLKIKNESFFIVFFLVILGIIRLSFLGKGALGITDEWRYDESLRLLTYLNNCDWTAAINSICNTQGRPADVLMRLPDALLQTLFYKMTNKPIYHPISLLIPTVINVFISLIITFLFYKISYIFLKKETAKAILATIVYAFLTNNNLYIRHILPYDCSLLFFLASLYLLSVSEQKKISFFIVGNLLALSFAIYPGYYVGTITIGVLFLYTMRKVCFSLILKQSIYFGLGGIIVFLFFEFLHQIVGKSYLINLTNLSNTINQGSFDEGFTFMMSYLIENDYLLGAILICTNILLIVSSLLRLIKQKQINLTFYDVALLTVFFCFLFHASLTFFFHKMVFYGRIIHFYLPFVVLAAFIFLRSVRSPQLVYQLTVFTAMASFFNFAYHFYQVNYPRDVAIENKLTLSFGDVMIREKADSTFIFYESNELSVGITGELPKEIQHFKLINFTYFYPLGANFSEYIPLKNEKIVYQANHFQSFKPYTFEGFNPQDRHRALERQYQIKIYKRE